VSVLTTATAADFKIVEVPEIINRKTMLEFICKNGHSTTRCAESFVFACESSKGKQPCKRCRLSSGPCSSPNTRSRADYESTDSYTSDEEEEKGPAQKKRKLSSPMPATSFVYESALVQNLLYPPEPYYYITNTEMHIKEEENIEQEVDVEQFFNDNFDDH
jgi:hypothetical protein